MDEALVPDKVSGMWMLGNGTGWEEAPELRCVPTLEMEAAARQSAQHVVLTGHTPNGVERELMGTYQRVPVQQWLNQRPVYTVGIPTMGIRTNMLSG